MAAGLEIALLPRERWWGGAVADGSHMPFGTGDFERDLSVSSLANQSAPLLISSHGRFVWCDEPFAFAFSGDKLSVTPQGAAPVRGEAGSGLRDVYAHVSTRFFPPSGVMPDPLMFTAPQYNTWIEMPFVPTQSRVLAYARDLVDGGFPPGVIMIDDRWSRDYGTWQFDREQFPDPPGLVRALHELGFKVMLWLVPYVSPDSDTFRALQQHEYLLRTSDGEPAIRRWWNGYSAVVDATNADAVAWLKRRLDALVTDVGVDGFKFDGGDFYSYRADDLAVRVSSPAAQCEAWARVGLRYSLAEYRACWKMGGQPLAQRLRDKPPKWGAGGLSSLIPEAIVQGLIGLPFNCPDMIGGGDVTEFVRSGFALNAELFVRYAQCAALFPMMQFSTSPARVLEGDHLEAVHQAAALHSQFGPEIVALAQHAAGAGEPILRPLAYRYPGLEDVTDQFMLGDDVLAAPVLEQGADRRAVTLPPGEWVGADGTIYEGPAKVTVPVDLFTVPWFRRTRRSASRSADELAHAGAGPGNPPPAVENGYRGGTGGAAAPAISPRSRFGRLVVSLSNSSTPDPAASSSAIAVASRRAAAVNAGSLRSRWMAALILLALLRADSRTPAPRHATRAATSP